MKVSRIARGRRPMELLRSLIFTLTCGAALLATAARAGDAPDFNKQNGRFVVFIHTGGGDAGVAERLAAVLRELGLVVARPDTYADTVGGAGVDYFSTGDAEMARFVAEQASRLLPGSPPLRARFQSAVHNPSGFLGVWLYGRASAAEAPPATARAMPLQSAYCFQEYAPHERRYRVACRAEPSDCIALRGADDSKPGTDCVFTDLSRAKWNPTGDGPSGSWTQSADSPFGSPFPQIDPAKLPRAGAPGAGATEN